MNINNNPLFDVFPGWEKKVAYRFPNFNGFSTLLNVANKLVGRHTVEEKIGLKPGEEFHPVEKYLTSELMRLVSQGWVAGDVVDRQWRLTAMGAMVFSWKLCWSVKTILNALEGSFSRRVLYSASRRFTD